MSQDELSSYIEYENFIKIILSILGLKTSATDSNSIINRSLLHLQMSMSLLPMIGIFNFLKTYITNVFFVTRGLSILVSFLTIIIKGFCIILNRQDVNELNVILSSQYHKLISNPKMKAAILKQVTTFRRLSYTMTIFVAISCLSYVVIPLISMINQSINGIKPIKHILPFPAIYSWNIPPDSYRFKLHFLNESLTVLSVICITVGVDNLYTHYVFQMIGFLRVIAYRMINFNEKNKESSEIVVRECMSQYETLINCRNKLQKIYGPIILWTMGTNAIILCAVIFQLSQMNSISVSRIILFTTYAGAKFSQVFIYAWASSLLTAESDKCRAAIYAANWVGNKRFMQSIIIMLSQKPLILTACNFTVVSMDVFMSVLNTTLSYFLLLNTFAEKT
nr:olfactory receptor 82 [Microplitis mediator]